MARLEIRLLGEFEVVLAGREVTEFESATDRALLARLASEPGHAVSRPSLAELLWPGRPEGRALGNLRHSLAVLRRAIGDGATDHPAIVTSPAGIALDPDADVNVDVVEFRRSAAMASSSPGAVAAWQAAVALRRGPFLDGFDAALSEEWDTWLLTTRTSIDERAAAVLGRLAELCEQSGEHAAGIELSQVRLEIDPWNEQAHRQLMRLLALDDRAGAALAQAEAFGTALRHELGAEPAAETRSLVDDIRSSTFPVRATSVPGLPPLSHVANAAEACVERATELAWLDRRLGVAVEGSGAVVFVAGQAGAGKSVLLRTFASQARQRNGQLTVLRGTCNAFTGAGDPYLPFRQILALLCGDIERAWTQGSLTESEAGQLWADVPATIEAILDAGPDLVGTLIDGESLVERFDAGFPGHPLAERLRIGVARAALRSQDPTRQQQPLLDQCTAVLAGVAARRPVLITIDDLHWADTGTVELLLHLARHVADTETLVVAAFRPEDVAGETTRRVAMLVNEVRALSPSETLLEIGGSRDFVDAWLDTEPNVLDEEFRDSLYRATHGHALFTVEMVRALRDRGELSLDDEGRWTAGPTITWTDLPPRVDATIEARLTRLPAESQLDLEVASAQGTVFTAELVAAARGVPPADVELRLGGLTAPPHALIEPDGTLRVDGRRLSRYRFRHALFQHYLYEHIAEPKRRVLHEQTGRAIEELYSDRVDDVAIDLARHFDRAELAAEAIEYLDRAGRGAIRLSAVAEAIVHFERAVELLDSLEPSLDRDRRLLGALTSLGACLQVRSGYTATPTTDVFERVRALIPDVGPSIEAAQALGALTTVDGLLARYAGGLAGAEQLLTIAGQLDAAPIEAVAHMQAGWMLFMTGHLRHAEQHLRRAIEPYEPDWDEWLTYAVGIHVLSTALAWRSLVHWHLGLPDQARDDASESIAAARRADYPFGLTFALTVAGCVLSEELDEPAAVIAASQEAWAIAEREGYAFYRAAAEFHHGIGLARSGDLTGGLEQIRNGLAGWTALGTEAFLTWLRTGFAEILVLDRQLDAAGEVLDDVERRLATGEERMAELTLPYSRGLMLRAGGDHEAAEREFQRALDIAGEFGDHGQQLRAANALAELLCDHERTAEARAMLVPIVEWFTEAADTAQLRAARRLLDRCSR